MGTKTAAAVDLGTNSVKLTIGRKADSGQVEILDDATRITRLGKGVDASGELASESVSRTLEALQEFRQRMDHHGVETVGAVGTSALRDARNGATFVTQAQQVLGGTVEIISGEREAALVYQAAWGDGQIREKMTALGAEFLVTTDSGGGSTEFVIGGATGIAYAESLNIGAVRLTEQTGFSDPPTPEEIERARAHADTVLEAVPRPDGPALVAASGGTVANLAAMEWMARNPGESLTGETIHTRLHGLSLTEGQIEARIALLAALSLEQRRRVPGLEPDRADVILAGAIIQARSLRRLGANELVVSTRGLRYGLLYELLG
ncbi:MAG: hypothetical protein OHK0029_35130 [Armatimonadaceae bacterium]